MNTHVRSLGLAASMFVILAAIPSSSLATWPDDPTVNVPLCTAETGQHRLVCTPDGAGGAIVAWQDERGDVFMEDIYAHHVTASGIADPAWPADGVALCTAVLAQWDPQIVSDGAGGAIVVWTDYRNGIIAQRDLYAHHITASGILNPALPADGFPICLAESEQVLPRAISDGAGGAIITWCDWRDGESDIYAHRVTLPGALEPAWAVDGIAVCTAAQNQIDPRIVSDGAGGAIIVWCDGRNGNSDIYAHHVTVAGEVDPAWPLNGADLCTAPGGQSNLQAVSDGVGGAFVIWQDTRGGADSDIYFHHVRADGSRDPAIPFEGVALCAAGMDQHSVCLAPDGSGGAIAAWTDHRNGTDDDIYAHHVTAAGAADPAWPADGVSLCSGPGNQNAPQIVPDEAGGAIVVWADTRGGGSDIYAQRVSAGGIPQWDTDGIPLSSAPGDQNMPCVVSGGSGSAIAAWEDERNGPASDVYLQRVQRSGDLSSISFTDIHAALPGVSFSSAAWGDYDNDGDLDLLIAGADPSPITRVYRNDGGGVFSDIHAGLPSTFMGSVAWGDYDNDGDLDFLLTGNLESGFIARVYRNDGGSFVDIGAGLPGAHGSSGAWGDYDNDGDLDLLLTAELAFSRVYRNDGGGVFTDIEAGLPLIPTCSVAWGDYDNDGDLDALLNTIVFRNDGYDTFTDIHAGLPLLYLGSVAWGDYDSDGDLDILVSGGSGGGDLARVYRNDGGGSFVDINAGLQHVYHGSAAWGDYDNDGDLDIALTGINDTQGSLTGVSRIYRNQGGVFADIHAGLWATGQGKVEWGDYDGDGDLDLLVTGAGGLARIYRNDGARPNTPPVAPYGAWMVDVLWGMVTLTWSSTTDAETPQSGLSYNLRVGTTSGGGEIVSPMSDLSAGTRRVVQLGNAQKRTSWTFHLPEMGSFWWSVQAVDGAYAGSPFTEERYFGPVPVLASLAHVDVLVDRVRLTWHVGGDPIASATVQRRTGSAEWMPVAEIAPDGSGYVRYEDRDVRPGGNYDYRLGLPDKGGVTFAGFAHVTIPAARLALFGSRPNPCVRSLTVAFSLPDRSPARLEVMDPGGRRILARDVGALGPGTHVLDLSEGRRIAPGVYLLRLTQGMLALTARAVVVQ